MKRILNKTGRPLRVRLPRGKTLHLGPKRSAEVSVQAMEHPGVKELIEAGDLEVVGEGVSGGAQHGGPGQVGGVSEGKKSLPKHLVKGDRGG